MMKEKAALKCRGLFQKIRQKTKKQKIIMVLAGVLVCVITAGSVGYYVLYAKDTPVVSKYQEVTVEHGDLSIDLSEDGTTQVSTTSQMPEFNPTVVTMTVEEVYVSSGDTVSAGDALFKITDESYQKAVAYYEDAIADASSDVDTASLNYSIGELEAEYEKQSTDTKAAYADEKYAAALATLDQNVSLTKTEYEGAQTEIDAYTAAILNNTYYTENDIDAKTQAVSEAQETADAATATYTSLQATYKDQTSVISASVLSLNSTVETVESDIASLQTSFLAYADLAGQLEEAETAYEQADKNLAVKQSELSKATENYQKEVSAAQTKIDDLNSQLESLESAYQQALVNAVTQKVEIEKEYNESVTEGQYADTTYDSTMNTLEETLQSNEDTLSTLEEEQAALLAMENGVVCASSDGTIAAVTYEADDTLAADTALVSYYDTTSILLSVEVPQADIAKISVGDSVDVAVSGQRDTVSGTVSTIATSATTSGNVSSVTYAVVVSMDNSAGTMSSGLSGTVTFQFGTISDVDYLPVSAVNNVSGTTAEVKQYDENKNAISVPVSIGDATDSYVVITDGLAEGDTCLIEVGGDE